jgi:hypothetical protein
LNKKEGRKGCRQTDIRTDREEKSLEGKRVQFSWTKFSIEGNK